MKIYYATQVASQIEEVIPQDISPKKYGTIGEHLAYAITTAEKFGKKIRSQNISKSHLNQVIKKAFLKRMHESAFTQNLLNQISVDEFDFTVRDLSDSLANLFILDNPASPIVTDERVELHIPDCPIFLTPIKYGIKFREDPNWYDIYAAYKTIFEFHAFRPPVSPLTNKVWLGVDDFKKFSIDNTANEAAFDMLAIIQLRAIAERLITVSALIQRNSMLPRQLQYQPAVLPLNFNVELPQEEFSGRAAMQRYLLQHLSLEMVPDLVGFGAAGHSSIQQLISVMQLANTLEAQWGGDIFTKTIFTALAVIPYFLMNYQLNSMSVRSFMRYLNLLLPERNNQNNRLQPNQEFELDAQSMGSFAHYFFRPEQQARRQQNVPEYLQNLNLGPFEIPIEIPNENQNNQPQPNAWSFSSLIQRFGFQAPSAEVVARAAAFVQNPYAEGRALAARLGFHL